MKTTLAIVMATLLVCSAAIGQGAATDTKKKSDSRNAQAPQKVKALPPGPQSAGAKTSTESKVTLNPQPLPPGAKKTSASPESKVALNPQPLPPGAKATSRKKGATEKSKKGSSSTNTGGTTPK